MAPKSPITPPSPIPHPSPSAAPVNGILDSSPGQSGRPSWPQAVSMPSGHGTPVVPRGTSGCQARSAPSGASEAKAPLAGLAQFRPSVFPMLPYGARQDGPGGPGLWRHFPPGRGTQGIRKSSSWTHQIWRPRHHRTSSPGLDRDCAEAVSRLRRLPSGPATDVWRRPRHGNGQGIATGFIPPRAGVWIWYPPSWLDCSSAISHCAAWRPRFFVLRPLFKCPGLCRV